MTYYIYDVGEEDVFVKSVRGLVRHHWYTLNELLTMPILPKGFAKHIVESKIRHRDYTIIDENDLKRLLIKKSLAS